MIKIDYWWTEGALEFSTDDPGVARSLCPHPFYVRRQLAVGFTFDGQPKDVLLTSRTVACPQG